MFKQVADVRTADTLDLATPEMKYHIENIEATDFQKTLVQELSDRADEVQSGNVDPLWTICSVLLPTAESWDLTQD